MDGQVGDKANYWSTAVVNRQPGFKNLNDTINSYMNKCGLNPMIAYLELMKKYGFGHENYTFMIQVKYPGHSYL